MRKRHLFLLELVLLSPLPFMAKALRMESLFSTPDFDQPVFVYAALALPIRIGVAHASGIYHFLWKHVSLVELGRLTFAGTTDAVVTVVTGAVPISGLGLAATRLPFSALLLDALLAAVIMVTPRLAVRCAGRNPATSRRAQHRAIIVGAGNLGQSILRDLAQTSSLSSSIFPVAFVDDDSRKHGQMLGGLAVLNEIARLDEEIKPLAGHRGHHRRAGRQGQGGGSLCPARHHAAQRPRGARHH